jgi:hypothetical protein
MTATRALLAALMLSAAGVPRPAVAQHAAAAATTAPAPVETVRLPVRVAVQTEAAFGVHPGDFYNQLVGARVDLQFSPHVSVGAYGGYANLKGKDGRAHDLLMYAQVEYLALAPGSPVRIPLRFASGYLPMNGPVVRVAAGVAFALTPKVDLVTELLAPTVWVTRDQAVLSMNLALELAVKF